MTLTEVLVSVIIMSIGVVLLSSLLPISILRTAQASQLTHATLLRKNAEAFLESNRGILSNAQICGFNGTGIIDPLGYFLVGGASTSTSFGATGIPRSSGGIGAYNISSASVTLTASQQTTALVFADQLASLPDSWKLIREVVVKSYDPSATPPSVTVSDSTTDIFPRNGQNPTSVNHRMVMYDITGNFAVIRPLFQSGATSGSLTNQMSWQNVNSVGAAVTAAPMPSAFVARRVRIESQDRRFTWLMTVKKRWVPTSPIFGADGAAGILNVDDDNNGTKDDDSELHIAGSDDDQNWAAEINLAVFFNRSFKPTDEAFHAIQIPVDGSGNKIGFDNAYGVAGVDDDGNFSTDDVSESGWLGSDDNRTIIVSLLNKPPLKKGGFILEPTQLKWYRIINFTDPTGQSTSTVLLDQDLQSSGSVVPPNVIIMKGIGDVYSLGVRTGTQ